MVLTEIINKSSIEFFEGIPEIHHSMLMDYIEKAPQLTAKYSGFVCRNCPELFKLNLIMNGFNHFDSAKLLFSFSEYCLENNTKCVRIMESGFLEDIKEFVVDFLESI